LTKRLVVAPQNAPPTKRRAGAARAPPGMRRQPLQDILEVDERIDLAAVRRGFCSANSRTGKPPARSSSPGTTTRRASGFTTCWETISCALSVARLRPFIIYPAASHMTLRRLARGDCELVDVR